MIKTTRFKQDSSESFVFGPIENSPVKLSHQVASQSKVLAITARVNLPKIKRQCFPIFLILLLIKLMEQLTMSPIYNTCRDSAETHCSHIFVQINITKITLSDTSPLQQLNLNILSLQRKLSRSLYITKFSLAYGLLSRWVKNFDRIMGKITCVRLCVYGSEFFHCISGWDNT